MSKLPTWLKPARRRPAFATCVALLVAVAVLANTAAFSALHALLWKPLPYAHGERLVELRMDLQDIGVQVGLSEALYAQVRGDATTFAGAVGSIALEHKPRPGDDRLWQVQRITPDFATVLGARPALGGTFAGNGGDALLLSDRAWRTQFGAAADVLGKTLRIGDRTYSIIGVMPPGFSYPDAGVDAWIAYIATAAEREQDAAGSFGGFTVAAALQPTATVEQARASLANVLANSPFLASLRSSGAKFAGGARAWRERYSDGHAGPLGILQSAAMLLLIVIATNLSGLVIAQFVARRREFAVRDAIGADCSVLRRQIAAELLPSIAAGAVAGLLLSPGCLALLASRGLLPATLAVPTGFDASVLLVALGTTLLLGVSTSLAALSVLRHAQLPGNGLRERAPSATSGRHRAGFMIGQVALCTALAGAAGLLMHSAWRLINEQRGFDANGVVLSAIDLAPLAQAGHSDTDIDAVFARLVDDVAAMPGVQAVGAADSTPFGVSHYLAQVQSAHGLQEVRNYSIRPGYFRAMGIALAGGRDFSRTDDGQPQRIVIDDAFRRARFGNIDPVGQTVLVSDGDGGFIAATIIGVAATVKHRSLDEAAGPPAIYSLMADSPRFFTLVTRSDGDAVALTGSIRNLLGRVAPDAALSLNAPMQQIVEQTFANRLALLELVSLFAFGALLLAALGLYATLSFEVSRRSNELGVRMALGATAARIAGLVMARGGSVIVIGSALGAAIGMTLAGRLTAHLYRVPGDDLTTWTIACGFVVATAAFACWLPARRAALTPPLRAMQSLD